MLKNRCWIYGSGPAIFLYILLAAYSKVLGTWVCFDPGHGGTDPGCVTVIDNYDEKDINLVVALKLKEVLDDEGCEEGYDYIFTRKRDTFVRLRDRCAIANGEEVAHFVSIHHNGAADTNVQGTEVFWNDFTENIPELAGFEWSGMPRILDSILAKKIRYDIRDAFGYQDRCLVKDCGDFGFWILRHTYMVSALSEASFVSQPSEAYRFFNDSADHIEKEAEAIYHGWHSYLVGAGIGIIDNAYANWTSWDSTSVFVDFVERQAPYHATWEIGEEHTLEAQSFILNGYQYDFHHWQHYDYVTG
jgi:N-acetylmuramoyl-L-alanine amidase